MILKLRYVLLITLCVFLASCGRSNNDDETPVIEGPEGVVNTPIPEAPTWREPSAPITRENAAQTQLLGRLDVSGTPSTLFNFAFSPDSTQLAALDNNQIVIWDLITGEQVLTNNRLDASYVFYSPDKILFYTIDSEALVSIYELAENRIIGDFSAHPEFSGTVVYDELNGWMAFGGLDGTVKVWDPVERVSLVTLEAHEREITSLAFSADGQMLASTALDGIVKVWRWQDREQVANLDNRGARVVKMAFSPSAERIALGTDDFITLWQVENSEFLFTLQTGPGGSSGVLMYSPDGKYLVNGGAIPDMTVWDTETTEVVSLLRGVGGDVTSASFSPSGDLLLASVLDGPVTLWDMTSITQETVGKAELNVGTSRVIDVRFTPDGYSMLFFDAAGPVYVWGISPQAAANN